MSQDNQDHSEKQFPQDMMTVLQSLEQSDKTERKRRRKERRNKRRKRRTLRKEKRKTRKMRRKAHRSIRKLSRKARRRERRMARWERKLAKKDERRTKPPSKFAILMRNLFSPYLDAISWLNSLTLSFLKRDASSSVASSLLFESVLALIDNLAPEVAQRNIQERAGPYFFKGNDIGVIVTHGFSSTAQEMKHLAEYLHKKRGYSVFTTLLAGHGTSPADLAQTDIIDWYKSIYDAYNFMKPQCKKLFLVGHSMGATLSLILSANKPVDGIVTLCAPIKVEYFMQDYLFLVKDLLKYFPRRKYEVEIMDEYNLLNYRVSALRAVDNLLDLMEIAKAEIPKVNVPLFTITAANDDRVPIYNAEMIQSMVKSKRIEDYVAPNSIHTILFGPDAEIVMEKIDDFLASLLE